MDEFTFQDDDGIEVFGHRWTPEGTPRAIVLVAHGLSEHSGRYARLADALVGAGYAVYAPDHRGHGRTAASSGVGRAGAAGLEGVLDDLHEVKKLATSEHESSPIVLFGHSMGSILAQAYAERYGDELVALVLSGSPGATDGLEEMVSAMRTAVDAGLGDEPVSALDGMNESFEPARTKFDWLSRDPAEVDAYVADPLCGDGMPPTYGFVADLMQLALDTMAPAGNRGHPVRASHPPGDRRVRRGVERRRERPCARGTVSGARARGRCAVLPRCAPRAAQRDQPRRGHRRHPRMARRPLLLTLARRP